MRKTGFKNPGNQYEGTFYILVEKNGSSQKFRMYGSNSPFTEEEKIQIILEYGKLRNQLQVRQAFRLQLNVNPKNVLMVMCFRRGIERVILERDFKPMFNARSRKSIITEDLIGLVKVLAEHIIYQQKTFSVRDIADSQKFHVLQLGEYLVNS